MAPKFVRHPVRIAVDGDQSEQGEIVFANGALVAVLSHLNETVDGELRSRWYLEAGFGPCDGVLPQPVFDTEAEAEHWIADRLSGPT